MQARTGRRTVPIALGVLAFGLTGCWGGAGGGSLAVLHEREPNDHPDEADGVGFVDAHDDYRIRGHVDDFDQLDGFAFAADHPVDVELVLYTDNPFADLVVYLYDPVTDSFPFTFHDVHDPLIGSFAVNVTPSDFHLVVGSLAGPSSYTLEVRGFPYGSYAGGAQPLASDSAGRFSARPSPALAPDARRAADALLHRYRRATRGAADEPGEAAPLVIVGRLAVVDDRGEVEVLPALGLGRATPIAPGRTEPLGPGAPGPAAVRGAGRLPARDSRDRWKERRRKASPRAP